MSVAAPLSANISPVASTNLSNLDNGRNNGTSILQKERGMRRSLLVASVFAAAVATLPLFGQTNSIDRQAAKNYFEQLRATSARDAGRLWGKPLYGPTFFVDRESREVLANQSDAEGRLKPVDGVFVGRFPEDKNIANTAIDWAG